MAAGQRSSLAWLSLPHPRLLSLGLKELTAAGAWSREAWQEQVAPRVFPGSVTGHWAGRRDIGEPEKLKGVGVKRQSQSGWKRNSLDCV